MSSNTKPIFRDQQDLVRWIDNKLGLNELWGSRQASFVLTREILVELETCFQELEPHIKLKIILAMIHLSSKTLQIWREPFLNIIEEARKDPDDWVETVAEICRQYPDLSLIQCSSKEDSYFHRTQIELEKIVEEKVGDSRVDFSNCLSFDSQILPNSILRTMLSANNDNAANKIQHFSIKQGKVARSLKMFEEVKKAAEQQTNPSNKKNHALISSFPIKIRSTAKKLDNSLPMKGFVPSANALKMSCGFTNESKKYQQRTLSNRSGGAMLIDIAELPNPNRRKRNADAIVLPNDKKKGQMNEFINNKNLTNVKKQDDEKDKNELVVNKIEPIISEQQSRIQQIEQINSHTISAFTSSTSSTSFDDGSFLPESHKNIQNPMMHFNNHPQNSSFPSNSNAFIEQTSQQQFPTNYIQHPQQQQDHQHNHNNPNSLALQQFDGLLKDANKLTSVTYNLIISFLSGNKSNPLQDKLGHLITLPFSETVEFEPMTNGVGMTASLIEIFFQMDYQTGEWKRLRKARELRPGELNQYGHLFGTNANQ